MITATLASDALVRRLETRAQRIAARHAQQLRQTRKAGAADWHSSQSLWPNFTRG